MSAEPQPKKESDKFALIIGNGGYSPDWFLDSPPLDAKATGAALTDVGFQVDRHIDLGFDAMTVAIDGFAKKLKAAPRVAAALFYYSGHGCARDRQNLMVPIDFDDPINAYGKLWSVQSVIQKISSARERDFVKIVLFDACRSGDDEAQNADYRRRFDAAAQGKGLSGVGATASPGGAISAKFNTMTGDENTFIAFATAEGKAAYATKKDLSPFSAAVLRNLDAVDLPLTNLMSRVRLEVSARTGQTQNTWDQSSLTQPFFFNPASILLFAGNAMALVGLFLSLIPYSVVLANRLSWPWTVTAALLPAFSLAILLYGMQSVYTRLKGSFDVGADARLTWREHLLTSLQKGVLGGYLGALVGGLLIGGTYYLEWAKVDREGNRGYDPLAPLGVVLTEITVATALTACLLGFLSLVWSRLGWWGRAPHLVERPSALRMVLGAILGGVIAGVLAAPVLTVYFGLKSRPDMTPILLIPGALFGAALIVFSIVNFDLERLTLQRIVKGLSASGAALVLGAVFAVLVMGFFWVIGLVQWDTDFLHAHSAEPWALAAGGAIYGAPVGAILGFVIGVAAVLTGRWSGAAVLQKVRAIDDPAMR